MVRAAALIFALFPAVGSAQVAEVGHPPKGVESSAVVGTPVFERTRYAEVQGAILREPMKIKFYDTVEAGVTLYRVDSSAAFKACDRKGRYCGIDDDGDGTFDRSARDDVSLAFKLKEPVRYEAARVPGPDTDTFKQAVIFLGGVGGVLRLSYREFSNDMARPAFTEDYSFEIGQAFPAAVAFRDVRMTVLAIESGGLRYRIDSTGAAAPE